MSDDLRSIVERGDIESLRRVLQDVSTSNFAVVIRLRPPLDRELAGSNGRPYRPVVKVDRNSRMITISENLSGDSENGSPSGIYSTHTFTFDHVYDQNASQSDVYETTAKTAVLSTLLGYNASIIAYGQTGTGKTFTMEGLGEQSRGIIPRSIQEIFSFIKNCRSPNMKFLIRASYLQIYNEVISDLLSPDKSNLSIREDRKKGVYVEGLSEWVVRTPAEIYGLMERGSHFRATASTRMNEVSSRSHAIFMIIVEQLEELEDGNLNSSGSREQCFRIGKLNLVDLAGSERVRLTRATGRRLDESKKINQSLSALGNVIAALTDQTKTRSHIPYRDSKLTRVLEDSLGGNCRTVMMAMISPALESFNESLSTLKFANRAKNIQNDACINEDLDQKALLRKYERELAKLRSQLATRSQNIVDKRKVLELEEQKRRAEEDKLAALVALESRSREFLLEKQEKKKLEEKISTMQSQLLGHGGEVKRGQAGQGESKDLQRFYESKLAELDKERQSLQADKDQIGQYKQLLLKQRDIMIALTARLNERDETILLLEEELEKYQGKQLELEEQFDEKMVEVISTQKMLMELKGQSDSGEIPNIDANANLYKENESLKAEVSNLNTLLQSNLEDLVKSEVQDKVAELKDVIADLKQENGLLKKKVELYETENNSEITVPSIKKVNENPVEKKNQSVEVNFTVSEDQGSQSPYLSKISKEREALKTIMEMKIRVLVDNVALLLSNSDTQGAAAQVEVLRKLVNAAVVALQSNDTRKPETESNEVLRRRALSPATSRKGSSFGYNFSSHTSQQKLVENLIAQRKSELLRDHYRSSD
ncbi:hypothetical protein P9112_014242 [Eukaryota sp. TZLM1-RC]